MAPADTPPGVRGIGVGVECTGFATAKVPVVVGENGVKEKSAYGARPFGVFEPRRGRPGPRCDVVPHRQRRDDRDGGPLRGGGRVGAGRHAASFVPAGMDPDTPRLVGHPPVGKGVAPRRSDQASGRGGISRAPPDDARLPGDARRRPGASSATSTRSRWRHWPRRHRRRSTTRGCSTGSARPPGGPARAGRSPPPCCRRPTRICSRCS